MLTEAWIFTSLALVRLLGCKYLVRISPEADGPISRRGGQVGRDPRHGRRTEVERGYGPRVLG
jgi:hypothetical protein